MRCMTSLRTALSSMSSLMKESCRSPLKEISLLLSFSPALTEVTINRTKYYRIDTNIQLRDIAEDTVQVSQVVSIEDVGQAFVQMEQTEQGKLIVCVRAVPSKVNLSFKAPLVAEGLNIQMVQE